MRNKVMRAKVYEIARIERLKGFLPARYSDTFLGYAVGTNAVRVLEDYARDNNLDDSRRRGLRVERGIRLDRFDTFKILDNSGRFFMVRSPPSAIIDYRGRIVPIKERS